MSKSTWCIAFNCDKKDTCKRHLLQADGRVYQCIDWSTMGSGGSHQPDIWICGNNSSDYPYYENIIKQVLK